MTAIPGLIDSHVHITFGDFTPRQQTVGYLESYVHAVTGIVQRAPEILVLIRADAAEQRRQPAAQMRHAAGPGHCRPDRA